MNFLNKSVLIVGGPLMWPLLIISIIGIIIFVERVYYLHKKQVRAEPFLAGIKNLVKKRRLLEALTVCEETPGPVVGIIKAALLNYDKNETEQRYAVQSIALAQIPLLERRLGTIATIANITPIIGCIGTVIALMQGFYKMQALGAYANAAAFSGEVANALIPSVTGLIISVFAYFAHHFLYGRVKSIVRDMEWVGNEVIQFLIRDLPEEQVEKIVD